MIWWIGMALAVEPPAGLNLDDPTAWDTAAREVVDGPPGCHDATGIARLTLTLYQMPDALMAARTQKYVVGGHVKGRLTDGVWTSLDPELVQLDPAPDGPAVENHTSLLPLVGRQRYDNFRIDLGDASESKEEKERVEDASGTLPTKETPTSLLRTALDEWTGDTETVYADWDPEAAGVRVRRDVALSKDRPRDTIRIEALFPAGGTQATTFDVIFPDKVAVGDWPVRGHLKDMQLHLRQDIRNGVAWPTSETSATVVSMAGFTIGIEQTILWQGWTSCR